MRKLYIITLLVLIASKVGAASIAQQRALTLGDGMNYSYLEQYWMGNPSINYADYLDLNHLDAVKPQIQVMHSLGFETLRLPVTFDKWEDRTEPYAIDYMSYFKAVDSIVNWCLSLNMNVIIVYHHGMLFDYNFNTELQRVIALWKQVATRYASTDPNRVFFELYNEPFDLSVNNWRTAANAMIDSLRPIVPNHTFIVGSTEWNSLYKLGEMGVLPDQNIIYNFHFYEPYIFTHQGATWAGNALSTTGIPFPYDNSSMPEMNPAAAGTTGETAYQAYIHDGTCQAIADRIGIAASWAQTNNVPLWCGEFGSYGPFTPLDDSRCRYTECVKTNLDNYNIPYAYWEWDEGFTLFNGTPSFASLPQCMQSIFDLTQDASQVAMTIFRGHNENENNILNWAPSSETNFVSFEVERGEDVSSFNSIAQVEGNGSSAQSTYSYIDNNPPGGISYYRIKQTDNNGMSVYTNAIPIMNKTALLTARISPNPSKDIINVKCDEPYTKISISTIMGSEIIQLDETGRIDISTLPQGIYILKLSNKSNVVAAGRFIKN